MTDTLRIKKLIERDTCENVDCGKILEPPIRELTVSLRVPGVKADEVRAVKLCTDCYSRFNELEDFFIDLVE